LNDERGRNFVIHDLARKGAAHPPAFRLPGGHASVVLLREPWRAIAAAELLTVVLMHHDDVLAFEVFSVMMIVVVVITTAIVLVLVVLSMFVAACPSRVSQRHTGR
jgi:hypothetical protein